MSALNIDNTATAWGDYLLSLADEAAKDALSTDESLALHGVLRDLALVASAYAGRLGVERGGNASAAADDAAVTSTVAADAIKGPAVADTRWIEENFAMMRKRIDALEERVAWLEDNQNRASVTIPPALSINPDAPIDDNPAAWDNITRARAALQSMIARKHSQLSRIRQTLLTRVTSLARDPARDSDGDAELRQHEARAEELGQIDAIAARKLDEIAGLDDLDAARAFAGVGVDAGWPQ